ncbi:NAD(P)/FAD-dependent oxidoreductase [Herbiconiux sp. YIM B11900]|uniref:NAD(P)/FAD-dependent oxidoreductase n=1 Tax=Herbiconiux sp. YIM B11900 TaxID=3404131 RepID=UPI003F86C198
MTSSDQTPLRSTDPQVLVVGAGIAGLACAAALRAEGVPVRVVERGRRAGGRMSGRTLHGRPVDLGASYFTVPDGSAFGAVVASWEEDGLAHPWTDTFTVLDGSPADARSAADGNSAADEPRTTTGPVRYAADHGLRSLLVDAAEALDADPGADVLFEHDVTQVHADGTVDGIRYDTVVLAMPEPQAVRLLDPMSPLAARLRPDAWEPVLAIVLGYGERAWPVDLHGAFVDGSALVSFIADDGDRRGDGAPVLVAHTTSAFAREHLEHPEGAVDAVTAEVTSLLGLGDQPRPDWSHAHRWTYARTTASHPEPYALYDRLAICGDAWGGRSSVSTAWASGDALGRALAARG